MLTEEHSIYLQQEKKQSGSHIWKMFREEREQQCFDDELRYWSAVLQSDQ